MLTYIITNPEKFANVVDVDLSSASNYINRGRFDGTVTVFLKDGEYQESTGEHGTCSFEEDYGFVVQEISQISNKSAKPDTHKVSGFGGTRKIMQIPTETMDLILQFKRWGDTTRIAEIANCTKPQVSKVWKTGKASERVAVALIKFYEVEIPKRKKEKNFFENFNKSV